MNNLFGKDISVVIPVYNSQDCLDILTDKIDTIMGEKKISYEIVYVNDSSRDNSWEVIKRVSEKNKNVVGICFRKNFGQDNALMAGIKNAIGKYIVIMDDDLQHDPIYIPKLYNEIQKGFDVVYANYEKKQKLWKNIGSWFNGKVAEIVLKKPQNVYLTPFKIIDGAVIAEICKYDGPYPYIDGLLFRVTKSFSEIFVEHKARFAGISNYSILKSIKVWSSLATNFSIVPLRVSIVLGLTSSISGILLSIGFFIYRLIDPTMPAGWASLILSVLTLGGIQLFSIGILGEYIGRTYLNINKHPQYVIKQTIGKKI